MSGANARYTVVPTVTVLAMMKTRLLAATKGHALLKKKADALNMRFRQILKQILEAKEKMGDTMKTSFFSMTEAKYAAGEGIKHTIFDNVETAQVTVLTHTDNVAGIKIPKYDCVKEPGESRMDLTGLSSGGQQISKCKEAYGKTVELLVTLASLQSAFLTLDVAIKSTNRRVNALENVVKPKVANTIQYIKGELDELEREEFFRLKKVQDKKERDLEKKKAEKEAEAKKKAAAAGTGAAIAAYSPPPPTTTSALPAEDADLIF